MNIYLKGIEVRWADLDPNFHVRHSAYYDWGAYCRMCFLTEHGLTIESLQEQHLGLIIFREECRFRKEIHFGELITIDLQLLNARQDFTRWTIRHQIYKNGDKVAATLTLDGTWIDTKIRKLAHPPELATRVFNVIPRHQDFEWINK